MVPSVLAVDFAAGSISDADPPPLVEASSTAVAAGAAPFQLIAAR